jgi:hypothetical protein
MWRHVTGALVAACVSIFVYAYAATPQATSPGLQPFTPTRIDWLTTTLQASLRQEAIDTDGYLIEITTPNPDTILIYVRYTPKVNRQAMNISIEAARQAIQITVKKYGWDDWVKIRENIQQAER